MTLSAQVSPAGATRQRRRGFFDGATTLGSGYWPLDANGIATISLTSRSLRAATRSPSAHLGDARHPGGSSQKILHTVNTDPVTVVVSGPAKVSWR